MQCLDEETILAYCRGAEGRLDGGARAQVEVHLQTCDECRALVSAVARSSIVDVRARIPQDPAMMPTTPVGLGAPPARALHQGADGGLVLTATELADSGPAAGPPSSPVRPGDVLAGKFEVERVLGAGGMGVVVAARHTQLDQRVALKFLLPAACEVPGAVTRFLREGKAAARITSEHVARVVDTGVLDGGAPYLVMEYLEGKDLGLILQERGALTVAETLEYVLQASEAIVEAHALGIVHRDLKPANLFLTQRKDGSPLVKVLDFGISKDQGGSHRNLTSASVLMGSPRYMSPEQMLSAKDVDARTDVWALGVILYELLTGRPVWEADTVQGLCALITSSPVPSLRDRAPGVPPLLERVVNQCLAKQLDQRIQSVADLASALEPLAPATARTSIGRILRVGGRAPNSPRSVPPVSAPTAHASTVPAASSGGAGKVALLLGVGVGVLLVAGLVLNAALARKSPSPAPLVQGSGLVASTGPIVIEPPPLDTNTTNLTSLSDPPSTPASGSARDVAPKPTIPSGGARRPGGARPGTNPTPTTNAQPTAQAQPVPTPQPVPMPAPKPAPTDTNRALSDRK